jgi:C-terminal processing protease CtpA/Prc
VQYQGSQNDFFPDQDTPAIIRHMMARMASERLAGNIGYIRIHNVLWDNNLIPAFDSVLNRLMDTKGIVLDLRETPGGGNTTVATGHHRQVHLKGWLLPGT